ncbi:hypothetical protein BX600DRAFT_532668, partial [Xylariales sp. PMI_506]
SEPSPVRSRWCNQHPIYVIRYQGPFSARFFPRKRPPRNLPPTTMGYFRVLDMVRVRNQPRTLQSRCTLLGEATIPPLSFFESAFAEFDMRFYLNSRWCSSERGYTVLAGLAKLTVAHLVIGQPRHEVSLGKPSRIWGTRDEPRLCRGETCEVKITTCENPFAQLKLRKAVRPFRDDGDT